MREGAQALVRKGEREPSAGFVCFPEAVIEQSLCSRFEEQVGKFPERLAVKTRNGSLSYRELNRSANRIARAILQRCGEGPHPVACLFSDEALWVAAILGILKAGKIYLTLDPQHPRSRTEQVWSQAQAQLLVTDGANLPLARQLPGAGEPLNTECVGSLADEDLGWALGADSLACILFTSGSTGQPKSVVHTHRNILHNIKNHTNSLRITAEDRLSLLSSRTTAQAVTGTYSALLNGAALCLFRFKEEGLERLAQWLAEEQITIYHSSASVFRHFAASLKGSSLFPQLRVVKLGSEPVSARELQLFKTHFSSDCVFVNALSSTETGMMCQYRTQEATVNGHLVPVGYAVPGMEVLIFGDDGQPVDSGEVGEIVVRSRYLPVGYWRSPDQSRNAFAPDPVRSDVRMFRTGDLGKLLPDGALVHLGRTDARVKIRGNRVELAEVEAALLMLPGVKQAMVAAQEDARNDRILVAYVVPTEQDAASPLVLRRALLERLPRYMVPSLFVFRAELPVTPQGKIDRRAIQAQRVAPDWLGPREDNEAQLVEIWKNLLGIERVGIREDFFDLGGDSLLAASLLFQIEQTFGKELSPSLLANGVTIEGLATALVEQCSAEHSPWLAGGQHSEHRTFFYLHGDYSGAGLYSIRLARLLGEEFPFYALQPLRRFETPLPASIELMASSYLKMLQSVQPHGPYLLGGYCNGGLIAFEIAQQLLRRGEAVELLFIFDSVVHHCKTSLSTRLLKLAAKAPRLSQEEIADLILRKNLFQAYWNEISGRERVRFVLENQTMIKDEACKWLRRMFAQNSRRASSDGVPQWAPGVSSAGDEFERKQAEYTFHFRRLVRGYVAQPYSGPITLLVSEGRTGSRADATLGWRKVSPRLELHQVPGDHHTCVTRHLDTVAEILRARLEQARPREESQTLAGAEGSVVRQGAF